MSDKHNTRRAPVGRTVARRALPAALTITLLLSGCAGSKEAPKSLLDQATDRIVEQSETYLRHQEILRERLEQVSVEPAPAPVVPAYDPLDDVKVTLDVDNADVQFVLQALTEQAGVNLLIHPTLVESPHKISVHFTDVPASTVLEQVLHLADLAGEVEDNVLVVKPLEERIFHLDFLEMSQTTRFSAGGDVLGFNTPTGGSGSGQGGVGANVLTGEFKIDGSSAREINPYEDLTEMLDILVGRAPVRFSNGIHSAASVAEVGHHSQITTAKHSDTPMYTLNRMTGTLYVQAKPSVMDTVTELVQRYKDVLGRQILLEAQILEVALDDEFKYGIDWNQLNNGQSWAFGPSGQTLGDLSASLPAGGTEHSGRSLSLPGQALRMAGRSFGSLVYAGSEFAATITLLQGFGNVSVLSNPTIRCKHGQASIISVGTSNSFIAQSGNTATVGVGQTLTQTIQTSTVFDGLVLGVVPFISDGDITLSIHPIQSSVDPGSLNLVDIGDTAISLPRVALKEISTLLRMKDGDVVFLGGLIDQTASEIKEQVPVLGDIPILGNLFRKKDKQKRVRELVVVLKVTLV